VPRNRVTAIVHGERAISADTALRLGRYFGTSAEFWLGLQTAHDLEAARRQFGERLDQIVPHVA
jgi:addiction module HigA family antidote